MLVLARLGDGRTLGSARAEMNAIVLVEWGDVVESTFGDHLLVRLEHIDDDTDARTVTIQPFGLTWAPRWARLTAECERALAAAVVGEGD